LVVGNIMADLPKGAKRSQIRAVPMAQDLWHHHSASDLVPLGLALDPQAAGPARGDAGLGEAGRARYPLAVLSAAAVVPLLGWSMVSFVAAQYPDLLVRVIPWPHIPMLADMEIRPEEGDGRGF